MNKKKIIKKREYQENPVPKKEHEKRKYLENPESKKENIKKKQIWDQSWTKKKKIAKGCKLQIKNI